MIIDARCRLTTKEAGAYFAKVMKERGQDHLIPAFAKGTIEAFFDEIGEAGITTAVSASGNSPGAKAGRRQMPDRTAPNDYMASMQEKHYGKLISVAGIDAGNVYHRALDEVDRCYQMGLRAIFIEPGRSPGCNPDDRRIYPIYEKCVERNVTVIIQTSGNWAGTLVDCANPTYIDQVAVDFPKLRIVAAHGCYPFIREAITIASRHENVYLEPDVYMLHLGAEDWVTAVNKNSFGFEDKYLYGSAYPLYPIKPYVEHFFKLSWKKEVLPKILYKNALRAFNLENDPAFKAMYKV
jgi:uncharacterized protein